MYHFLFFVIVFFCKNITSRNISWKSGYKKAYPAALTQEVRQYPKKTMQTEYACINRSTPGSRSFSLYFGVFLSPIRLKTVNYLIFMLIWLPLFSCFTSQFGWLAINIALQPAKVKSTALFAWEKYSSCHPPHPILRLKNCDLSPIGKFF